MMDYPQVLLAHGGGGKLMHELIEKVFIKSFSNDPLNLMHDGAVLDFKGKRIATTTDSYVIKPILFPGGNIGELSVYGTVNDLAMCGARALYLTAGFILEEGLSMELLWQVVQSMKKACERTGVQIVTGDTKVVDKGKGDGIFINTSGVGVIEHEQVIGPKQIKVGDLLMVNGDLGRHGMAIMATREGLEFESTITSDLAPLTDIVQKLLNEGISVHCIRDLTRGGLASASNELAQSSKLGFEMDEAAIPVSEEVRAACEILGLDPLYVACEGRFVAFIPQRDAERALALIRGFPDGVQACVIGKVVEGHPGLVTLRSTIGAKRIVDMMSGEQLPRIC